MTSGEIIEERSFDTNHGRNDLLSIINSEICTENQVLKLNNSLSVSEEKFYSI